MNGVPCHCRRSAAIWFRGVITAGLGLLIVSVASAQYSGGTGEPNDPYQIATAADLIALGETPEDDDKHFILTADIDLDPNVRGRKIFDKAAIVPDVNSGNWEFDGRPFTGTFDGNGRTISHLTIQGSAHLGLFGCVSGGAVKDPGMVASQIVGSGSAIGGLTGESAGIVTRCYSSARVSGDQRVGGLVGVNGGNVNPWRSSLYPEDWRPGYRDQEGRFLHDFSYAGYHRGEVNMPSDPCGSMIDVTQAPYQADRTGVLDATAAIQTALDAAGAAGGGIVYLPPGTYRIKPPGGADYALSISHSGVVLRGAGSSETFLFNDETYMRYKSVIRVAPPGWTGWHAPVPNTEVKIAQDVGYPTHVIPVIATTTQGRYPTPRFQKGDWVVLRADCTEDFIAEHGMSGLWDASLMGVTFYRRVTAVDTNDNTITVDIPTRYYLKTRDNARVYKVPPHLEEVGIEHLSIGMRENLSPGLGENDYDLSGTAAYDVHFSQVIEFYHVVDGWIQNVQTYRPPVNANDWHTLSNIILLSQSRNVTVRACAVAKPQYEGGGGNGYGYTLSGSDCLLVDCNAFHTRHNYDFKSMWTSGNVIFRCITRDSHSANDFHMHLSPANLIDSMVVDGGLLEARYRPYGGIPLHGHSTTESVFWNTWGTARCNQPVVVSQQWKWGYVIGTGGPVFGVKRGIWDNTAPEDFLEGEGQGEALVPQSLYLDQLFRRHAADLDCNEPVNAVDFGE